MFTDMQTKKSEPDTRGYILLGALILVTLSAIIIVSALNVSTVVTRSTKATKERTDEFYKAEDTMGAAVSWLRSNSSSFVLAFSRQNFYTNFDKTTAPSVGTNDTGDFAVATKIKAQGTSNSIILSDDSTFQAQQFPNTVDASTGNAFNSRTTFDAASLGNDHVRVTLVDAIPTDSAKDYGDTDSGHPTPDTDFSPVFRVDSLKQSSDGGYVFGYVIGSLAYNYGIGFYGQNLLDLRQSCDSYISNNGAYTDATKRANCPTGAGVTAQVHQTETVYGTLKSNGTINTSSPYGGTVCSDFSSPCTSGQTCQGGSCNVPGLPTYSNWATYCPTNQGDVTINVNSTLTVAGNNANQKCWNSITVNANKTLTLRTTSYSYFIDTFNIANNAILNFSPNPSTGTINLYVRTIVGNTLNGNQLFNTNNKPYQLRIHYLGNAALTLNGTAAMNAFLVAPYATVNVQGNFTYNGGIKALSLAVTGSGKLHYDESGDITTLSDVSFKTRNVEERFR